MSAAIEMLGKVPLFEGLSKRELETVFTSCKEQEFVEGREIVEQGSSGVGFHLILDGEVEVLKGGKLAASLGPGTFFGEMSLLDGGPRSATVRAKTPVRTVSLTSWEFRPLLERTPSIAIKLLEELCRRLRATEPAITD